jgi:GNAT superfamily N-acetyltransferase
VTWRLAGPGDAAVLRDLEREANLVGLAHVFPPADFPFPDAGVLARWKSTLADPEVTVELFADPAPVAFVAHASDGRVRHLGVHPDRWGHGLARAAVQRSVTAIRATGRAPVLWVLAANERARGLYEHLGWVQTGRSQRAEWPPYPMEVEYRLPESAHER